jgi:methionyl-tRNA formyltransferase
MESLRTVFMGTADLACPILRLLAQQPFVRMAGVVTQPDRPKGRDLHPAPPPVKTVAVELSLPVFQPERIRRAEAQQVLADWSPELVVVAAYGQILPKSVLDLPRWGCLNVHASILPKYRGASPIQWSILQDEPETGVTIMKMDEGLDTGDILTQQSTAITPQDTAQTLHDRLASLGAELLVHTIPGYVQGGITPRPQPPGQDSYARKISKEDGRLSWLLPARRLWNQVRAFNPWPGSFFLQPAAPRPMLVKVWAAEVEPRLSGEPGVVLRADAQGIVVASQDGALRITELQREGKRRLKASEYLAGNPIPAGLRLE